MTGRRVVLGSFGTAGEQLSVLDSTTMTVPPARVRVDHVHRGGLASLRGAGTDRPYWRDGGLHQPWSNEDDPSARTLFYTAQDMYQDPNSGVVYYDGEDDASAVGAFEFLKKLFTKNQPGVAQPTALHRGTGGPDAQPLAPTLGVQTLWVKHELMPGLQLRVRRGVKLAVANVGTPDAPVWMVTPGVKTQTAAGVEYVGILPLLLALVKGGAAGRARKSAQQAAAEPEQQLHVGPGQQVNIGAADMVGSILGVGSVSDVVGSFGSDSDVMTGALLIDSDGRRIQV